MTFSSDSLDDWVAYIQTLHVREIELSLERVRTVYRSLCPFGVPFKVISVAGTNGKGSTSEIIASIYREAGYSAGKFTSPHLVRFNERFNINGVDASDSELIQAFDSVEKARADTPITYFEYGLLLAIALFVNAKVDVAILEVGLGGRLDAVNILDADVALITSIALDHTAWLGDTLDEIAYEKSGIARTDRPCVVGVRDAQTAMIKHLNDIEARIVRVGRDFDFKCESNSSWAYSMGELELTGLPLPFGQNDIQLSNAALALTAINLLVKVLPIPLNAVSRGLGQATLAGRCQVVSTKPTIVLDVSHNEASLARLVTFIRSLTVKGKLIAVCGMLKDKEISASLARIAPEVCNWHLATIQVERGASAGHMRECLHSVAPTLSSDSVTMYDSVEMAFRVAQQMLTDDDCLVVFGSFYVVGDIIRLLDESSI